MSRNLITNTAAALIFLFPAMLLTVTKGGGAILILLILVSSIGLALNRTSVVLNKDEKWLLATVAAYVLIYILNVWYFSTDISELDNTLRFLILLPVFYFIRKQALNPGYLIYAILLGTVACFGIAIYQKFSLGFPRAQGVTNPVSFGGLSITLAMMSFAVALLIKTAKLKALFFSGFILATIASVLSSSRGAWAALISGLFLLFFIQARAWSLKARVSAGLLSVLIIMASYFIPTVQVRIDTAITEVGDYLDNNIANTSVGIRLETWRGSAIAFADNPIFGIGEGNFRTKMKQLADQGLVDPVVPSVIGHVHNEYISAALHRGIIGLLSLSLLFIVPLLYFSRSLIALQDERKIIAATGVMLVMSSITVALSDIFFGQQQPTIFYASLLYIMYSMINSPDLKPD